MEGERPPKLVSISTGFEGYYPIFINWRSGLLTSYSEHLVATRQGERWHPVGGWATSPFMLIGDLGRAVFRAPMVWIQGARSGLQSFRGTPPFGEEKIAFQRYNLLKELEKQEDSVKLSIGFDHGPPGMFGQLNDESKKQEYYNGKDPDGLWTEGALKTTSWFVTLPTKAIAAPAIDGMGKPAWDIMNRRTELLRRQPCEFDKAVGACNDLSFQRTGAVAKFLDELVKELARKEYSKKEVEMSIIGHSMGAIVANWIISDYGAALKPKNIVYMAAASSIRDFETKVVPYLKSAEGKETRFFNLTLHPRAEVRERNGDLVIKILDFAPRGSLLVWIDNYLSNPETFLDRTLGRWDNIIVSTQIFPKKIRKNINIKAFGICKWGEKRPEENPEKHGEFSDGEFWRPEYWDAKAPIDKCNLEHGS